MPQQLQKSVPELAKHKLIAAIQIKWKQFRPSADAEESRAERLEYIRRFLGKRELSSVTKLTTHEMHQVLAEFDRQLTINPPTAPTAPRRRSSANILRFPPKISHEQKHTLEKLASYLKYDDAYIQQFFSVRAGYKKCRTLSDLSNRQANKILFIFLRIAADAWLKNQGVEHRTSAQINAAIPQIKRELSIGGN